MNFALLAPAGLAALAALALPILVHLLRRPEQRVTPFAALRWLSEMTRPRQRLRLRRWLLLAARLALLACLALLLARPVRFGVTGTGADWVVVAPGITRAEALALGAGAEAQWHWLAPDFPGIDTTPSEAAPAHSAGLPSLLRELDATLPGAARLTVVVPETLDGLDAERVRLGRDVRWLVQPTGGLAADGPAPAKAPIHVLVRHDPAHAGEVAPLRAAIRAWNVAEPGRYTLEVASLEAPLPTGAGWLFWLGSELPPEVMAWVNRGGVVMTTARPEAPGATLWQAETGQVRLRVQNQGRGRLLALATPLAPAALPELSQADFSRRLREAMAGPSAAPDAALARDVTPLKREAFSLRTGVPLDSVLALAIAMLFLLERFLAGRVSPAREASR